MVLENLARFATNHGVYLDRKTIQSEIEVLRLACRIASLAKSAGMWEVAVAQLEPYQDTGEGVLLRELGHALCILHRREKGGTRFRRGQRLLKRAVEMDQRDAQAHAYLAWSWEDVSEKNS